MDNLMGYYILFPQNSNWITLIIALLCFITPQVPIYLSITFWFICFSPKICSYHFTYDVSLIYFISIRKMTQKLAMEEKSIFAI